MNFTHYMRRRAAYELLRSQRRATRPIHLHALSWILALALVLGLVLG
jgi:hypothetical protein